MKLAKKVKVKNHAYTTYEVDGEVFRSESEAQAYAKFDPPEVLLDRIMMYFCRNWNECSFSRSDKKLRAFSVLKEISGPLKDLRKYFDVYET